MNNAVVVDRLFHIGDHIFSLSAMASLFYIVIGVIMLYGGFVRGTGLFLSGFSMIVFSILTYPMWFGHIFFENGKAVKEYYLEGFDMVPKKAVILDLMRTGYSFRPSGLRDPEGHLIKKEEAVKIFRTYPDAKSLPAQSPQLKKHGKKIDMAV